MRKLILFSAALLTLSLLPLPDSTGAQEPKPEPEFIMEVGTVAPSGSPWAKQLKRFKKHVQETTAGRMKVKLRLGRSNERSLARRTATGTLQAYGGSLGGLSSIVREVNVIESPYLFEGFEQPDKALDNPDVMNKIRKILEKRQLIFGLWSENGYRSYFSNRPIRKPDDMRGVRFRSQESSVHVATYEAFGATPVPIDVGNVLTSVQTGVVDGFDNTALFAMAGTWYQGLDDGERNLLLSRHCYQPAVLVFSKKWYDKLPKDIQEVLDTVPHELSVWGRNQVRKIEPVLLKNLERYGYKIHEPSRKERAAFKEKQQGVADRVAKQIGPEAVSLLKAVRDAM